MEVRPSVDNLKSAGLQANPGPGLPELGIGVVYSAGLEPLFDQFPEEIDVIEIEPQTMWLENPSKPEEILVKPELDDHIASLPFRKLVHSIGTPVGGSVPGIEAQLPLLRNSVQRFGAPWASEHFAFNLTPDFFTGFFLPPRQTHAGLDIYAASIDRLRASLGVPLAIETGVNYLRPRTDEIPDGEFVAQVTEQTNCGILLDLHNIYANECNGRQKVTEFLQQIPLDRVWEVHLAGGLDWNGYWLDAHSGPIPERLFELSKDIIPDLPNLKAIIFEVFASFLPSFGINGVRKEAARLRQLWELRSPNQVATTKRSVAITQINAAAATVAEWEAALGSLVVGRTPGNALGPELASDPGTALMRELIHEFRASMVVSVYRLSCRLMMLALTPTIFRRILEDFWSHEPPHQYAATEAEAFIAYLRAKNLRLPKLDKILEFEKAAMDTMLDGQTRVVRFQADPFPLLRALSEGRLPDILPQEGDYEIELKPEGPITVSGIDPEMLRGSFPFH
jgi:uncharacterized protein (UPF0276 family)